MSEGADQSSIPLLLHEVLQPFLLPITAVTLLVGLYCTAAGADSFLLPMRLMHSSSKNPEEETE